MEILETLVYKEKFIKFFFKYIQCHRIDSNLCFNEKTKTMMFLLLRIFIIGNKY